MKTPLYDEHVKSNGRMIEFAGWEMPVQYIGLKEEHMHVRSKVGLFDVSHMGEVRVRGPKSLETLEWLTTNSVAKLQAGQAQYSLLPNNEGGLVDDLIIYCVEPGVDYLVCVNAANKDKDFKWMLDNNKGADITDESEQWGQIAVQGPQAMALLEAVLGAEIPNVKPFHFANFDFSHEGQQGSVIFARTGYTGEDGGEVFVPRDLAAPLWRALMTAEGGFEVQPIGLGARDTLRLEKKYSLYGQEIDATTNPYAAGLGWVVKPKDKDFLGKEQILAGKEQGLKRKLVGFKLLDKGIPRHGYRLLNLEGEPVGEVTSGTQSPSLGESIGIGYIDAGLSEVGSEFLIEIRARRVKAKVVNTPFV